MSCDQFVDMIIYIVRPPQERPAAVLVHKPLQSTIGTIPLTCMQGKVAIEDTTAPDHIGILRPEPKGFDTRDLKEAKALLDELAA
jgi:hypothetical protein